MVRALFLSSGLLSPKKHDIPVHRLNRYLNYPLLSLATNARNAGRDVLMCNGMWESPEEAGRRAFAWSPDELYLSLPSSYSLAWARRFLSSLRREGWQGVPVVGGRWVVDGRPEWVAERLGPAIIVEGAGEGYIAERCGTNANVNLSPDYLLLEGFDEYQPSVEVARGCGMGCEFCVERDERRSWLRSPDSFVEELARLRDLYVGSVVRPFVQAPLFRPSLAWAEDTAAKYSSNQVGVQWRAESRVDMMSRELLQALFESGLRVLDLGLESASPSVLLRMGKTRDPSKYLARAERTMRDCAELGIRVKLNVVWYAGETPASIDESREWLVGHRELISGLSVNPAVVYSGPGSRETVKRWVEYGAVVDPETRDKPDDIVFIHPSRDLSRQEAVEAGLELSRELMTMRSYFELKQYGYFPPRLTYEEFVGAVEGSSASSLPFKVDP